MMSICLATAPGIFGRGAAAAAERPLCDQSGHHGYCRPDQKDQTISCHAFGTVDAGSNDVRHIYLLPDGKGYLLDYFHQQIVGVYWADRSMVLIAALSGVRGQKPEPASFVQAQYGFRNELAGGQFADAHQ